jgi:alcohol dehydrogenase class IV
LNFDIPAHLQRQFTFQTAGILPPNGVLFGFGTILKIGEQAAGLGCRRAFLVTDKTMVRLGYADLVRAALIKEGIHVDHYDRVEPEPHMETAEELGKAVRQAKPDLVAGLGGGSPMDMAKLAAILATNDESALELMTKKIVGNPPLKKILIPTTAGSGSEVSGAFVASAGREKYYMKSMYGFPEIAVIDPGLTVSVPAGVTASSGIDALSHALESLMNRQANPLYDSLGLGGAELITRYLPRAFENGHDLEARYYMSLGSAMSMISLSGTGGLYAHSLSYVLARFQAVVHGEGCAVALPHTMAFNAPVLAEKFALIAGALGERIEAPGHAAKRAVQRVYDLIRKLGLPVSLKAMNFRYADLDEMAEICVTKYPRPSNPRPMSKADCRTLLEAMWEGTLYFF